ncbi:cytochrome c oxidase subunit II [Roseomonas alkaliterrae]|uniref:Cytochrome c oxidase subunit 2 n=1 Tax=Neoroseomonas alkaliterrae TaxID=1452450 RepID=A0A840YBF9_9PROT|nr:cytochrome c oxidase subunit II [Neoroseomonas alkaliterrae]MBB5691293.1 cytochrome c oxidase subunit 2 [Neoroseomonas alkaliterrae]MBR0676551.1 cytochrome c oxidase subunit II [Neoroseomonas alkaliterrae]
MRLSDGKRFWAAMGALAAVFAVLAAPAMAQGMVGAPTSWGMGLQESGGPIKDAIAGFNALVFGIIVAITIFVFVLLVWCVWRYRAEVNPTPSTTSHNTMLEVAWTVVPVLILIVIAIPSFRLVYYQDRTPNADLTISVQGRQWYWNYTYPDHGNFTFDSYPLAEDQLPPNQRHLFRLAVDNELVIPVGANVRVLTTGRDVIHSFFVPSLGVQKYTIPGRTLETWMRADREGVYYGQCNQICGTNHWFMPIAVRAVSREEFDRWVAEARQRFARADEEPAIAAPAAPADTVQIADARR